MDPDERFTPNPILSPRPRVQWCVCVSVCLVCSAPTVSLRRSYWLTDCKHENKGTCNHFNMEWSIPMVIEIIFVYNVTFFFNVSFFKEWGSPSPFVFFFCRCIEEIVKYWKSEIGEGESQGSGSDSNPCRLLFARISILNDQFQWLYKLFLQCHHS